MPQHRVTRSKWRAFLVVTVLAAIGASPFLAYSVYYEHLAEGVAAPYARGNARPFEQDGWLRDEYKSRHWMVSDLLDRYDFVGWTAPEVANLLGPVEPQPDGFYVDAGEDIPGAEDIRRGYRLVFTTDPEDRVSSVEFVCYGRC